MKREVLIPFEVKNLDPEWLSKKYSGQRLTAHEKEQYLKYKYERDFVYLKTHCKAPAG